MAEMAARWVEDGTAERLLQAQRRETRQRHALLSRFLGPFLALRVQMRSALGCGRPKAGRRTVSCARARRMGSQ
jgi:DNA-binding transcriptional MocR family regulator